MRKRRAEAVDVVRPFGYIPQRSPDLTGMLDETSLTNIFLKLPFTNRPEFFSELVLSGALALFSTDDPSHGDWAEFCYTDVPVPWTAHCLEHNIGQDTGKRTSGSRKSSAIMDKFTIWL
eukprot:jgi/Botrbrau1/259/Bobra.0022s0230.1